MAAKKTGKKAPAQKKSPAKKEAPAKAAAPKAELEVVAQKPAAPYAKIFAHGSLRKYRPGDRVR